MCVLKLEMGCFAVDKLQFEPPLRKETEARDEMVRTSLGFSLHLIKIIVSLLFSGSTLSNMSLQHKVMGRPLLVPRQSPHFAENEWPSMLCAKSRAQIKKNNICQLMWCCPWAPDLPIIGVICCCFLDGPFCPRTAAVCPALGNLLQTSSLAFLGINMCLCTQGLHFLISVVNSSSCCSS